MPTPTPSIVILPTATLPTVSFSPPSFMATSLPTGFRQEHQSAQRQFGPGWDRGGLGDACLLPLLLLLMLHRAAPKHLQAMPCCAVPSYANILPVLRCAMLRQAAP